MSPKSKAQVAEIRERSQANIREAALELFARQGFAGTTISQIAQAAGISKGLLYNYFESKEALLEDILGAEIAAGESWWQEIIDTDLPAFEKLHRVTHRMVEVVSGNLPHWRLLTSLAFQPELLAKMEAVIARKKVGVVVQAYALFRDMGVPEPERETYLFGATLDGIMLQYMNMANDYPLREMIDYFLQRYEPYRPHTN